MENKTVGFALTGSFCTFAKVVPEIKKLSEAEGIRVQPIMSEMAYSTDTRFGKAEEFIWTIEDYTSNKIIHTIRDSEPIGPKNILDALIIAPCTGNTLGKIANGVTDSCVTMAAKASLRNDNPLIIAVSTNDALGANAKNIGALMNMKNVYFVPLGQDAPHNKPTSLVAHMELILPTLRAALEGRQLQPVILGAVVQAKAPNTRVDIKKARRRLCNLCNALFPVYCVPYSFAPLQGTGLNKQNAVTL